MILKAWPLWSNGLPKNWPYILDGPSANFRRVLVLKRLHLAFCHDLFFEKFANACFCKRCLS